MAGYDRMEKCLDLDLDLARHGLACNRIRAVCNAVRKATMYLHALDIYTQGMQGISKRDSVQPSKYLI